MEGTIGNMVSNVKSTILEEFLSLSGIYFTTTTKRLFRKHERLLRFDLPFSSFWQPVQPSQRTNKKKVSMNFIKKMFSYGSSKNKQHRGEGKENPMRRALPQLSTGRPKKSKLFSAGKKFKAYPFSHTFDQITKHL